MGIAQLRGRPAPAPRGPREGPKTAERKYIQISPLSLLTLISAKPARYPGIVKGEQRSTALTSSMETTHDGPGGRNGQDCRQMHPYT